MIIKYMIYISMNTISSCLMRDLLMDLTICIGLHFLLKRVTSTFVAALCTSIG